VRPDLYTPWREDLLVLEARHVGRAELLDHLVSIVSSFCDGKRPLPILVFGTRGAGKSHLLTMLAGRARRRLERAGIKTAHVPEDIPALKTAADFLTRIADANAGPAWRRWKSAHATPTNEPTLVIFEGLDRQLASLGVDERRNLRRELGALPYLLIGSGVTLHEVFTGREEAFFGAFDPYPIEPLDDDEAAELLRNQLGTATLNARHLALVALAGGSPRTLLALAAACRQAPDGWAADDLYHVVHDFTAHYQIRFKDLAPQGQSVVELLAMAPRELTPTEMGASLGMTATMSSTVARRLVTEGVAKRRKDGRQARFALAEPPFRFWLEYRNAPWTETRVRWLGRLLQTLLSAEELGALSIRHADAELRAAASSALPNDEAAAGAAFDEALRAPADDQREHFEGLARAHPMAFAQKSFRLTREGAELPAALASVLAEGDMRPFAIAAGLVAGAPRQRLRLLLKSPQSPVVGWLFADLALRHLWPDVVPGRAWSLTAQERKAGARLPYLRATLLTRGKRPSDPPLLTESEILRALEGHEYLADAWRLIGVACLHDHGRLFAATLRRIPWLSLECPTPATGAPSAADEVGRAIVASADNGWRQFTWAATIARMDPLVAEDTISALATHAAPDDAPEAIDLALAALATQAPDRYAQLCEALGADWSETVARVDLLLDQLSEAAHGRLHPELALVAERLKG